MAKTTKIQRGSRRLPRKPPTKAQIAARVRRMLRPYCDVECFYRGGLDLDVDTKLTKLAGKPSSGSGMWLEAGIRDIAFKYPSLEKAIQAAKRIKAAKVKGEDGKRVIIMMQGYWKA